MARIAVYSPSQVSVIFAGINVEDGLADPFVSISAAAPQYNAEQGADDKSVVRYKTNNRLFTVEIGLKGYSKHHAAFSALLAVDDESDNGAGVAPFMVKDNNGSSLWATDKAWIMGIPDMAKGATAADVTWQLQFVGAMPQIILGGN